MDGTPKLDREEFLRAMRAEADKMLAENEGRGLLVTNRHVLVDENVFSLIMKARNDDAQLNKQGLGVKAKAPDDFDEQPVHLAALHRRLDIALLMVETKSRGRRSAEIINKKALRQGEAAVALGSPAGLEFFSSSGVISSASLELDVITTTCPISPGNSGGPLILSRGGYVVGINTWQFLGADKRNQNLNLAIPLDDLVRSLVRRDAADWIWTPAYREKVYDLAALCAIVNSK